MTRHDEVARVARGLYELSGRIEGRDVENWHEAERIVMAGYQTEEKTQDRHSGVKAARKRTVKKAAKEASGAAQIRKPAVTPLRKSQAKSRPVERN